MATIDNFAGISVTDGTLTGELFSNFMNSADARIGVLEGVGNELSHSFTGLELEILSGVLAAYGRYVQNDTSTIDITVATGANEFGYVILEIDLAQATGSQVSLKTVQQVTSLPTLTQDDLTADPATGKYQFPIISYEVSTSAIVSSTDLRDILTPNEGVTSNLICKAVVTATDTEFYNNADELIYTVSGANPTSIIFDDLVESGLIDIDGDGGKYKIIGNLYTSNTTRVDLSLFVNGDTTGANYSYQRILADGSSVGAGRSNLAYISSADVRWQQFELLMTFNDSKITAFANTVMQDTSDASILNFWNYAWKKTDETISNITSISLVPISNGLAENTKIEIYKVV